MASKVTLSQLEALSALARTCSYSKAAELLGYSEPGVHQQVRAIELRLKVKLFEVKRRRVHFTAIGCELAALAKQVVEGAERFHAAAARFQSGTEDQAVTLAAGSVTGCFLLRYVIPDIQSRLPTLRVRVQTGPSETRIPELLQGVTQIGITSGRPGEPHTFPGMPLGLVARPWFYDEWLLVEAADKSIPDYSGLSVPRHVFYVRSHPQGDPALLTLLASAAFDDRVECTALETLEAVKSATAGGLGQALLPGTSVIDELKTGLFKRLPFCGVRRQLYVVTLPDAPELVEQLCQVLTTWNPPRSFGAASVVPCHEPTDIGTGSLSRDLVGALSRAGKL